jgi:hypothetical protein
MSVGLNLDNVKALHSLNPKVKPGQDKGIDKLMDQVATRSKYMTANLV